MDEIAHVLGRVGDREAQLGVVVLDRIGGEALEHDAVGAAAAHHLAQGLQVDAALLGGEQGLRGHHAVAEAQHVVDQLHLVAGADVAAMDDEVGEALQHRADLRQGRGIAAGHQAELAGLRLLRRAGHRRVDEAAALGLDRLGDLERRIRHGGGAVRQHHALVHAGQEAVLAEHDILELGRIADHGEDQIAVGGDVARALQLLGALADQVVDRAAVAVGQHIEREALGQDVLADAVAHQADADQTNALWLCHIKSSQ